MAFAGVLAADRRSVFILLALSGSLRATMRFSHGAPIRALYFPTWITHYERAMQAVTDVFLAHYSNLFKGLWQITREYGFENRLRLPGEMVASAALSSPFGPGGREGPLTMRVFSTDQAVPAPRPCAPCVASNATCYITGEMTECLYCAAYKDSLAPGTQVAACAYAAVGRFLLLLGIG